jgi:thiamine pyrophosphokinase
MIANGAACRASILNDLLEWSPYILALDGAANRLHALGIKIDALLGDLDSVQNLANLVAQQQPIQVVRTPNQNKTDFEKGLDFLIANGHKAVNILWATGYRTDHTLANLSNIIKYKNKLTINIIDDYGRTYMLRATFTKYYAEGTVLSLMPMPKAQGITTHNLLYPLHNETLEIGRRIGSSNQVAATGQVHIVHTSGNLLLTEVFSGE